jgi:hypothetical protein
MMILVRRMVMVYQRYDDGRGYELEGKKIVRVVLIIYVSGS